MKPAEIALLKKWIAAGAKWPEAPAAAPPQPGELVGDLAFLRRATLDATGRIPTPEEIAAFENDAPETRRAHAIDRLLEDKGWADRWTPYWQDVLAENPNILKPNLNNTGPFRWWIHESLYDNKPMDRFVTELVMMRGSVYGGGPAGFALATQNDVPMAAKAHVLSAAFLGTDMKCARCHDSPYHSTKQGDLFSMAAMLERKPITIPKTSSVVFDPHARKPLITVTLKAGTKVEPGFAFHDLAGGVPDGVVRDGSDSRERLAAWLTSPNNWRFAEVLVNRMWERLLGRGIVEDPDDWEGRDPSHPDLLRYLARDFVIGGYDLKRTARLIMDSHAYQRAARAQVGAEARFFAAPQPRRLSAEQIVDSLFAAAGKDLATEQLNMDIDGASPASTMMNLGYPRRAWEFASLSNERDRPALAMPRAQSVVDALEAFGWRSSRQAPESHREQGVNALQPATLLNGNVSRRIASLSDDSAFTDLALRDQSVEALVEATFLRILTRRPTPKEAQTFARMLADGYADRLTPQDELPAESAQKRERYVSWSNHLSA
ncbi:MAG: DUF1553 domain-containing protein [Verrucomicrobiales bacterium]